MEIAKNVLPMLIIMVLSLSLLILVVVNCLMYMRFDVSEVYFTIVVESFM
jgi:hypothetical protein